MKSLNKNYWIFDSMKIIAFAKTKVKHTTYKTI